MVACINCHKKSYYISRQGLCKKCMAEKILFARSQIKNKSGPVYDKWKTNLVKGLDKLASVESDAPSADVNVI